MSSLIKANNVEFNGLPTQMNKTITLLEKHEIEQKKEELELLENELRKEYEKEIYNLKREVIDAHKQITEWQERYQQLNERFSTALQSKDQAIKESVFLENQLNNAREELNNIYEENRQLRLEEYRKEREMKLLRELILVKLSKDVNAV